MGPPSPSKLQVVVAPSLAQGTYEILIWGGVPPQGVQHVGVKPPESPRFFNEALRNEMAIKLPDALQEPQ